MNQIKKFLEREEDLKAIINNYSCKSTIFGLKKKINDIY